MKDTMKRPLLTAALLCFAVSGGALADHQAPNLKSFKTLCVSGDFEEQGKPNDAVLDTLLGRMGDALDAAGIAVTDDCEFTDGVAGKTQLNLYYTFVTTNTGTAFDAALEGWLSTDGKYTSVTIWRDSFFGSIKAGSGAIQAADNLDDLMDGFIAEWDSVH